MKCEVPQLRCLPRFVERRSDFYRLFAHRVTERKAARVERDLAVAFVFVLEAEGGCGGGWH